MDKVADDKASSSADANVAGVNSNDDSIAATSKVD
jgi:hypothetical protein